MKKYSLTATYKGRSTTSPILARNKIGALVLMSLEISKRYAADPRYDKGEITLKSPTGQTVVTIPEEKEEPTKKE